jgi:hypothetical protein
MIGREHFQTDNGGIVTIAGNQYVHVIEQTPALMPLN